MYQPKPINPEVFRLANAARMLLEAINTGELQAIEGKEEKATEVSDALQRALDDVITTYPNQVSPFLRYRKEIMGNDSTAKKLRELVAHLFDGNPVDLWSLISCSDTHHIQIVLELIESYSRNGERDKSFMELGREILERMINEEKLIQIDREGPKAKVLRVSMGLTQQEFWGRLGVAQATGNRYEVGQDIPLPVRHCLAIAYSPEPYKTVAKLRGEK